MASAPQGRCKPAAARLKPRIHCHNRRALGLGRPAPVGKQAPNLQPFLTGSERSTPYVPSSPSALGKDETNLRATNSPSRTGCGSPLPQAHPGISHVRNLGTCVQSLATGPPCQPSREQPLGSSVAAIALRLPIPRARLEGSRLVYRTRGGIAERSQPTRAALRWNRDPTRTESHSVHCQPNRSRTRAAARARPGLGFFNGHRCRGAAA